MAVDQNFRHHLIKDLMAPHRLEPVTPSPFHERSQVESNRPLKIIVIGAGISGLAAAAGLRRAGHNVEIFEQSAFANEVGAAIHVCPNASRILLKWGLDPVVKQFDETKSILTARADTYEPMHEADCSHMNEKYGAPWYLAHRVDLHNALKELALGDPGKGSQVKTYLRSKVTAIEPSTATVTLADGTSHQGDLIVAADGSHSSAIKHVIGHDNPATPTGTSAFRFLIPTADILADEQTKHFLENKDGKFKAIIGERKRLIWYPCRGGTMQNFVGMHPDNAKYGSVEEWNITSNPSHLLEEYSSFHPDLIAVMRYTISPPPSPPFPPSILLPNTPQQSHRRQTLETALPPPIPTWHRERLVLIGDAAHPMLPHQGQAGAQGIEDGAAIGVLLAGLQAGGLDGVDGEKGVKVEAVELEQRLQAFEAVRRKRASVMQIFSNAGQDEAEKIREEAERVLGPGARVPANQAEFHEFNFGHDVVAESEELLRELLESGERRVKKP
ncbi:uncharacterized protein KY384_006762 [Bacidia gigantensis]|uniref:uncharacterized protein n=1 Tax=Bacidia gigantensis TaxID=2732470 RepID=UPI001D0440BC|nr:uncharacterized protein KY384_006762 [Bacidia gigantensis]KAG8527846.1 hypothetical protein KY384_006762 [Bacidia gigantensis]